ncbi:MAG: glucokinase, partial [Spirochaetales bacterium]|nr:glucokinase [Spirochaetales bacterium]
KCSHKSNEIDGLEQPLKDLVTLIKEKNSSVKIDLCCISAAGPVANNYCKLTNCKWDVDGDSIEKALGIKTLIINDFLAIGYGIPTLDVNNPEQITKLATTKGSRPEPEGNVKAVVGAGTGLGVGFLISSNGIYRAHPSEGGHSGFAAYDDETKKLKEYVTEKIGETPGTEPFVSGQGITNIFKFYKDKKNIAMTGIVKEIDAAPDEDKPALISQNAGGNPVCKEIMELFISMYGRFAGSLSVVFMPFSGMYLAGGIVTKNEKLFIENNLFMKNFEQNYNPNIRPVLQRIPVYIIKDYSISLYGAANAAVTLVLQKEC